VNFGQTCEWKLGFRRHSRQLSGTVVGSLYHHDHVFAEIFFFNRLAVFAEEHVGGGGFFFGG